MATYYINADTGNDSTGTGTVLLPWKTIYKAYSMIANGDTIVAQNSVAHYTWEQSAGTYYVDHSTKGYTLTGQRYDGQGAIFDNGAGIPATRTKMGPYSYYYKNLTFTRIRNTGYGDGLFSVAYNTPLTGLWNFDRVVFRDIDNYNHGWPRGALFAPGFSFADYSGVTSLTLNRCLFDNLYNSGGTQISAIIGGMSQNPIRPITILNSTFYMPTLGIYRLTHLYYGGAILGIVFRNNIIVSLEPTNKLRLADTWSTAGIASNNCLYNLDPSYTPSWISSGTGTITSDPQLVDPSNDNFNLRQTSPCRDTGVVV